jgi:uncharacterized iron-regulated membrane protein
MPAAWRGIGLRYCSRSTLRSPSRSAMMGILFPLVGISLVAVLLLDYLLIARIPVLKQMFS